MIDSRVLLAFLSYIEPLPRKKSQMGPTFEWTISQMEEIQLHALAVLAILLPYSINEYFEYHVGTKLLVFYEWTINDGKIKTRKFFFLNYLLFIKMNIKVKEIVFLVKVVEIINDLNYDMFFDYFVVLFQQEMNVFIWIYVIKELFHRLLVRFKNCLFSYINIFLKDI